MLMRTQQPFHGRIAIAHNDSEPDSPSPPPPRDGQSPNVLIILLDDMGFGNLGCYGSTIETPNMDALAENAIVCDSAYGVTAFGPIRYDGLFVLVHEQLHRGEQAHDFFFAYLHTAADS